MITGGCLCGAVQYEYRGSVNELIICHCNQCKKAQGTVFAVNAPVKSELFTITRGEYLLRAYYSNEKKQRVFCSICGSPLYSAHDAKPGVLRLRAGSITTGLDRTPDYQQYCESKAQWLELNPEIRVYQRAKS